MILEANTKTASRLMNFRGFNSLSINFISTILNIQNKTVTAMDIMTIFSIVHKKYLNILFAKQTQIILLVLAYLSLIYFILFTNYFIFYISIGCWMLNVGLCFIIFNTINDFFWILHRF
jgi:hypothetical protein